jgi:hypothetical protein
LIGSKPIRSRASSWANQLFHENMIAGCIRQRPKPAVQDAEERPHHRRARPAKDVSVLMQVKEGGEDCRKEIKDFARRIA